MVQDSRFDKVWQNDPATIRKFIENRPNYEQLCIEVSYTLQKRLDDLEINFAFVTHRAKTLESFLEKISNKKYKDPFNQVTDFAGVRVVYLYQRDLSAIESILEKEYLITEKVDKLNEKEENEFGYLANHYIVELGKVSSGARYDDCTSCRTRFKGFYFRTCIFTYPYSCLIPYKLVLVKRKILKPVND